MSAPTCRVVGLMNIQNEQAFADYRAEVGATIEAHGGRLIFRGFSSDVFWNELNLPPMGALVELEFPSAQAARSWAQGPAYQRLLQVRGQAMVLTLLSFESLAPAQTKPTVYFDGGCPLCRAEISAYQKTRGAETLHWIDLAQATEAELGPGLKKEQAMARMHVRRANGELVQGAAAFAEIWKAMPAWAWLGRLVSQPWVLPMADGAYAVFLKVRPLWRGSTKPNDRRP